MTEGIKVLQKKHYFKHFFFFMNSYIWQKLSPLKKLKWFFRTKRRIKEIFLLHENQEEVCYDDEKQILLKYSKYRPQEALVLAEEFFKNDIEVIKQSYREIPPNEPILLCNVKNDLRRIQMLISHHRKIGINYFAILDNCSTDGTKEWLLEQDIDLYSTDAEYNSVRRAMWMQKIAERYGFNRWFVIIDSDELLVYEDMETKPIQDIIRYAEKNHIDAGLGMMIDMYAESCDLYNANTKDDIFNKYCYFDSDSYEITRGKSQICIHGGFRQRYFEDGKGKELMTKYPLFYWRKNRIYRYHFSFPYKANYSSPLLFGLLHYKFLDGDYEKYKKISEKGNYAGGSALYKKYIKKLGDERIISFIYEGSTKFESSKSLQKINVWGKY